MSFLRLVLQIQSKFSLVNVDWTVENVSYPVSHIWPRSFLNRGNQVVFERAYTLTFYTNYFCRLRQMTYEENGGSALGFLRNKLFFIYYYLLFIYYYIFYLFSSSLFFRLLNLSQHWTPCEEFFLVFPIRLFKIIQFCFILFSELSKSGSIHSKDFLYI